MDNGYNLPEDRGRTPRGLQKAMKTTAGTVNFSREQERATFSNTVATVRLLNRSSVADPQKLLAKLLAAQEVAELLGLKLGTIRNMTSRRELPCVRLGKRAVRYRLSDILALIETRTVTPVT